MKFINQLTLTEIHKYFYEKGGKLYWAISRGVIRKDSLAGCNKKRYLRVVLDGKEYCVHRILYQIYHNLSEIPNGLQIDHIDMNRLNNNKENLRLDTNGQNQMNSMPHKNNKIGYKNIVIYHTHYGRNVHYQVKICVNKNRYTKLFQYNDEGLKQTILHRDEKLQELHGEFANLGVLT
jgi:hypothetical protein